MMLTLRNDIVEYKRVDRRGVAIDLRTQTIIELNHEAMVIWHWLAEGVTVDVLLARFREATGVDEARASADVGAFLEQLRHLDLLAPEASDGPTGTP